MPGGAQETGETLAEAAIRELREETGLSAQNIRFFCVRDRITRNSRQEITHHYVLATYLADEFTGTPQANDDATDIGWFSREDLQDLLTTPETPDLIAEMLGQF